uniref:Uncharacterized protein n=1 Tax=Rhizophora mucronata TaxID=61149 RepID=A0A2P2KEK4_RHIMU
MRHLRQCTIRRELNLSRPKKKKIGVSDFDQKRANVSEFLNIEKFTVVTTPAEQKATTTSPATSFCNVEFAETNQSG